MNFKLVKMGWTLACALLIGACNSDKDDNPTTEDTATEDTATGDTATGDTATEDTNSDSSVLECKDTVDSIYQDPGPLPANNGAVIRCAREEVLSQEDIQTFLGKIGYVGEKASTSATRYRILYRTTRPTADGKGKRGTSSGLLFVPDKPRSAKLPLISVSHGVYSLGRCIQSQEASDKLDSDFMSLIFGIVSQGYAVVASDYAGYANYGAKGNPPSGFAFAEDVAASTLDSLRAARFLQPDLFDDKNILVGHSQGGHTLLSSLAWSERYAPDLEISAAVAFAPLWFSQTSWGAIFVLGDAFAVAKNTFPTAVGIWYFYSHAAILEGQELETAAAVFAPDKRETVQTFFKEDCGESHYNLLTEAATLPRDLYDPDFVSAITGSAAFGTKIKPCSQAGSPKKVKLCETWMARFQADRPHLEGSATKVPLLLVYGGNDTTIPPERMKCGVDRLEQDGANMSVCFTKKESHGSIVRTKVDYALRWLEDELAGKDHPTTDDCDGAAADITMPDGTSAKCAVPPPND